MKKHDIFEKDYDMKVTYQITLKAIDEYPETKLDHLPYKDMKRALKVLGKSRRHIVAICEYTGEIIYEKYESYRVHDNKKLTRRAKKLIDKYTLFQRNCEKYNDPQSC
jgi:hypothetical protein